MALILTDRGDPSPPSDIVRRLQQVHESLGLRWCGHAWGLTYRWRADDPRRAMMQSGELSPEHDHDILVYLPTDCSAEEAFGYMERAVTRNWMGRDDIRQLCDRLFHYNEQVVKHRAADVLAYGDELIAANRTGIANELGGAAVKPVFLNDATQKPTGAVSNRKRRKGRAL